MICFCVGSFSACERGRKKLFPRESSAVRYFCVSKFRPWKFPSRSKRVRLITRTFSLDGFIVKLSPLRPLTEGIRLATLAQFKVRGIGASRHDGDDFAMGCLDFIRHDWKSQ